jgi:signal peptidase II
VRRVVLIAALLAVADQLTKWLVLQSVSPFAPVPVIPGFFQIVHWRNTGAAWGVLRDNNLLLTIISVATMAALFLWRRSFGIERTGPAIALGLIAGGIAGNLIDRLLHHSVVDFLDFYVGTRHWPAFNLADSGICVGVALYFIVGRTRADVAGKPPAPGNPDVSVPPPPR